MRRRTKGKIAQLEDRLDNLTCTMIRRGLRLDDLEKQVADLTAEVEKLKKESK